MATDDDRALIELAQLQADAAVTRVREMIQRLRRELQDERRALDEMDSALDEITHD